MSTRKRNSLSETRVEEHFNLLKELESLPLRNSYCDICHCECYNSHRIDIQECFSSRQDIKDNNNVIENSCEKVYNTKTRKKNCASTSSNCTTKPNEFSTEIKLPNDNLIKKKPKNTDLRKKRKTRIHSKNNTLQRSRSQCSERHYAKDSEVLQNFVTTIDHKYLTNLEILTDTSVKKDLRERDKNPMINTCRSSPPLLLPQTQYSFSYKDDMDSSLIHMRLSESMANLCLTPTIKKAYNKVPDHDKRILNRMATKRCEQAAAKENSWLARKYWENERYERELLKCEQMEEYKKAVRDKQFQDYLQTKARLNEIAQRDLAELQRLRESLQQKDDRARSRLQSLRTERDLTVNQKRFEEMRKIECVNLHQEEQNLDEMLRKNKTCQRLTARLQRADHIRNKMLENYLNRLRYDNYIEQLQHEEHLREVQLNERLKRDQLKEQISRKRCRSQHFVETKQQRNESIRKTAKLSKSLRDLVRSSVSPEIGVTLFGTGKANNLISNLPE